MFGQGREVGCRRCSRCSIHYPPGEAFAECQVCEEPTSYFSNVEPDPEWKESVRYAKMHPPERVVADPHNHRFEQYLLMGFDEVRSQALAQAIYGPNRMPLYHGDVKKTLDATGDHDLVFDLYT